MPGGVGPDGQTSRGVRERGADGGTRGRTCVCANRAGRRIVEDTQGGGVLEGGAALVALEGQGIPRSRGRTCERQIEPER